MIALKKISMTLLFTFFIGNAFSTMTIENDTGVSSYRVHTTKGIDVQNFRLRATFHETAKDLDWLNENHTKVNKAYVPEWNGTTSKPVKIDFPGLLFPYTKSVTLYLTASSYGEENPNRFLSALTFKLDNPQWVDNIHIIFKGLNDDKSPNVELSITNSSKIIEKIKSKLFTSYVMLQD
ncbi:MAG: hypothetical protein ACRYGR_03595 [Janthinobacterium lividum]